MDTLSDSSRRGFRVDLSIGLISPDYCILSSLRQISSILMFYVRFNRRFSGLDPEKNCVHFFLK